MHFGDSIFIFLLALVLFGPKKLPEMARQLGKLMAEFRRASNEFKLQIEEEMRTMEQQERQKKLEAASVSAAIPPSESVAPPAVDETPLLEGDTGLTILPPSMGAPVSTSASIDPAAAQPETDPSVPEAAASEESTFHHA